MPRGVVDVDGIQSPEMQALKNKRTPEELPFNITKIGHVVLRCQDIEKSVAFSRANLYLPLSELISIL